MLKNNWFLTPLLYNLPCKLPIGNCHYVKGCNLAIFSNLLCIEKSLTNLTCNCKNKYFKC